MSQVQTVPLPPTSIEKEDDFYSELTEWINKALPQNYNFEIVKTLKRLKSDQVKHVALQFPEGLLNFSTQISQILQKFIARLKVTIMGDVTYGACCIDDVAARAIGCDFLVHYGHSCLVPIDATTIPCMYVFVDILFEPTHLVETIKLNFKPNTHLALMSTIQFIKPLHMCAHMLKEESYFDNEPFIPQTTPLTSGEVLGCTSPVLNDLFQEKQSQISSSNPHKTNGKVNSDKEQNPIFLENTTSQSFNQTATKISLTHNESSTSIDTVVFVADGRFHLESAMIQNPSIQFYRYDPFTKHLLEESYEIDLMHTNRQRAISAALPAKKIGIILGTLGRQGNTKILESIQNLVSRSGRSYFTILQSEIIPYKLKDLNADIFIQIACPRLSIDWGHYYHRPMLNPYEAFVAYGNQQYLSVYPMDFYSKRGGAWTNYHHANIRPSLSTDNSIVNRKALLRKRIANKRQEKERQHTLKLSYETS